METKREIRKLSLSRRRAIPKKERDYYSSIITEYVIKHPFFIHAQEVYCYASYKEEVSTVQILENARKAGKRTALPKINGNGRMCFYYVTDTDKLYLNQYGIFEPGGSSEKAEATDKNVLVIIPGAAFDRSGRRIGYGGGYYDRFLKAHPAYHTLGIAFDIQCFDRIPDEQHDIRLKTIITEKGELDLCS